MKKPSYHFALPLLVLLLATTFVRGQTLPQTWQPPELPPGVPNIYAKQGFPKEQSAAMLDAEVRQLLDAALRLYREPGLFTSRSKALEVLGVVQTSRRYDPVAPAPGGYPKFKDTFASQGLFARPAWAGEYRYSGKIQPWDNEWHEVIRITVDRALECINSRAVEGYLDLMLAPDGTRSPHYFRDRKRRHDVILGRTSAPALSPVTPTLDLTFSDGCLHKLNIASIFNFKDISDDNARH